MEQVGGRSDSYALTLNSVPRFVPRHLGRKATKITAAAQRLHGQTYGPDRVFGFRRSPPIVVVSLLRVRVPGRSWAACACSFL